MLSLAVLCQFDILNKSLIFLLRDSTPGIMRCLSNVLSTYDWSSLYDEISADAVVDRLNVVIQATDLAVPSGHIEKHKCLAWFFWKIKLTLKRKIGAHTHTVWANCRYLDTTAGGHTNLTTVLSRVIVTCD
jgi:hypothetical protein